LLDHRIHMLIVDPFPPGPRDPNGVHAAIWQEMHEGFLHRTSTSRHPWRRCINRPGRPCRRSGEMSWKLPSPPDVCPATLWKRPAVIRRRPGRRPAWSVPPE
jgi:hypothetical protein